VRIAVVDDHPLVRKGLVMVLSLESEYEVVGEAETVDQGIAVLKKCQPDIALVDLRLGNDSGLNLIERARVEGVNAKYVILTSSSDQEDFREAEQIGINGYILKEALPEELVHAMKIVGRGRKYYDPGILELKMRAEEENTIIEDLTQREKDVLIALGQGLNNRAITEKLFVSESTVKKHISQILSKLNLADRTQAALYAHSKGLVKFN